MLALLETSCYILGTGTVKAQREQQDRMVLKSVGYSNEQQGHG